LRPFDKLGQAAGCILSRLRRWRSLANSRFLPSVGMTQDQMSNLEQEWQRHYEQQQH
jgi:hypothetical protein